MGLFREEEKEVEVLDKPLRCQVCTHTTFYKRTATLHGSAASFFNVEWASPQCTCIICSQCGYVHWFLPEK